MLPTTTLDGRLVADPELRFTAGGRAVCSFRVACSDSKKDDQGNWETTEQLFVNVSTWEGDAEAHAELLRKGDAVLISGRLYQREYDDRDGNKRTSLEVKFPTVAKVVKAVRGGHVAPASQPRTTQNDPWGTSSTGSDEAPF